MYNHGMEGTKKGLSQPNLFSPEQDDRGVDLSLLRYMLGLSPLERLVLMEKHARDTEALHELGRKHRETKASPNR